MPANETKTSIASRASMLLAGDRITSLDSGETPEAEFMADFWDQAVRSLLTDYDWPFAQKRNAPARLPDAPLGDEWLYSYELPDDFLKARGLDSHWPYDVTSTELWTDDADPVLIYTREPSPQEFPPQFAEALVFKLAALAAMAITEDARRADLYATQAERTARRAIIDSLQSRSPDTIEADTFVDVRRGG